MAAPDDEDIIAGMLKALDEAPGTPVAPAGGHPAPPPLPARRPSGASALKSAGASRPDPFPEPPQPRLPMGANPEAKLEYFRQVVRIKEETLERARGLYADRVSEVEQLRLASAELEQLRSQHGSVESRVAEIAKQLAATVSERIQVSRALVEANAKLEGGQKHLEAERAAKAAMQQSLDEANARAAQLEGEIAELRRAASEEAERVGAELARVKGALARRDAGEGHGVDLKSLRAELAEARQRAEQAEAEQERLKADQTELALALETATWRSSSAADAARAEARAAHARALSEERAARETAEAALAAERRRRSSSTGPLADLHAALGEELEEEKTARAATEAALAQAEAALEEERAARVATEEALAEAKGTSAALGEEVALLTAELSQSSQRIISDESGSLEDSEREAFRREIAALKKKLVTAESVLEAAASLRQKVSRLEAQLRAARK